MPSLGNAPVALSDYERDLQRIDSELVSLQATAFVEPLKSADATLYAYRLFARSSLNGNLRELRAVETTLGRAITSLGPAEDLCLLRANLHFKLHRVVEARQSLAMAPALAGRKQGRVLLADIAFQEGHYAEARAAFEAFAAEEPTWDVLARLAHIEGKMGDAAKADQLYLQAEDELTAKEMRSFAWIELQRGLLDLARGRVDDALAHYDCADRAYSGYWLTAEHIGDALGSADHYARVLAVVQKPEVAEKLGILYSEAGNDARAEQLFAEALNAYLESVKQGEVHYYHHLTEFFADVKRDGEEALRWAQRDIALRDNFNTQTALAWALHCAGQSRAAVCHIEKALQSGVKDAGIFNKAASIFDGAGEHARAHEWERRAAYLNPSRVHAHIH